MAQINLRNPKAVALVERLAARTGKSKTAGADVDEVLADLEHEVHARIRPEHLGCQPSRDELEIELGIP